MLGHLTLLPIRPAMTDGFARWRHRMTMSEPIFIHRAYLSYLADTLTVWTSYAQPLATAPTLLCCLATDGVISYFDAIPASTRCHEMLSRDTPPDHVLSKKSTDRPDRRVVHSAPFRRPTARCGGKLDLPGRIITPVPKTKSVEMLTDRMYLTGAVLKMTSHYIWSYI